jgi:hypothetical protein
VLDLRWSDKIPPSRMRHIVNRQGAEILEVFISHERVGRWWAILGLNQ